MPRKKSKKKLYFDLDVQDAIIEYNASDDDNFRSRIYSEKIHYAFDKLAENIINTFKFMYFDYPFEEVKNEVVAFLVMNMHKYDHTKGSKAFSYFSIVAKNYLILHNNNNYKKLKTHDQLDVLVRKQTSINDNDQYDYDHFITELIKYFNKTIPTLFKKKKDIAIAYSILELLEKREEIENFNKKALYILIREMTDVETSHITKVANVLRKHYRKISKEYYASGYIVTSKSHNTFF
tara:strand:+ start:224 stop:931 length:708 start_codon:yes stop_codon:yes gene_type:complete